MIAPYRLLGMGLFAVASLLATTSCGPVGLGMGIGELSSDDDTTVFLLLVNNGNEVVRIDIAGADSTQAMQRTVAPGETVSVPVANPGALRVRAVEQDTGVDKAPVTWDFVVPPPTDGTSATFGVQSTVVSSIRATTTSAETLEVQRLVSDATGQGDFERVSSLEFDFEPAQVILHPSGGYLYTLEQIGPGEGQLRAFRFDASSAALELVTAEFGSAPLNPQPFAFGSTIGALQLVVDPQGRAAYLIDSDTVTNRSVLSVYPILADGSLDLPTISIRGRIGDLAFRSDGRMAYVTERAPDTMPRPFFVREILLGERGEFVATTGRLALPCVANATEPGTLAVHPTSRFLYVAFENPDPPSDVKLAVYSIGPNGTFVQVDSQCSDLDSIEDLEFDPAGSFLYVTGTASVGERVLRYRVNQVDGTLDSFDTTQDLGDVSNLTRTRDPQRVALDPNRDVVYVAVSDELVPHTIGANGQLAPIPGSPSLPFGSSANTRLVQGTDRGTVTINTP